MSTNPACVHESVSLERPSTPPTDARQGAEQGPRIWQARPQAPVNEYQRRVINRLLDDWQGYLTPSKCTTLATCSWDTAQRDIKERIERGVLAQNGAGGRSTGNRGVE